MSTRCDGFASRSFIIGSRLWPPAMIRASGPSRSSEAIAPSTLVARSYSNGAGVCNRAPLGSGTAGREALARRPDVLAPLVLLGGAGTDHGGARERLGAHRGAPVRVQRARGQAPALDVAQQALTGAGGGDRRLAPEPRERERALGVDLADARGDDLGALGEGAQPGGGGAGVQAVDEPDGVRQAGLLDEQALEQLNARVELLVDRGHDLVDGRALLDDAAHVLDHVVEAGDDLAQLEDGGDEEDHEREDDQDDRDDEDDGGRAHRGSSSSRMTSREAAGGRPPRGPSSRGRTRGEPPYPATPATVCLTCSWVVSSSSAASRSSEPAAAVAAIPRTVGVMVLAASSTPLSRMTTMGNTTRSSTRFPIHQSVIAASARRRWRPCARSRAARRGSRRTGD